MAILTTQLGDNSWMIEYSAIANNYTLVANTIREVLNLAGWADIAETDVSNTYHINFKAPMVDDPNVFKHFQLKVNANNVYVTTWEEPAINTCFGSDLSAHNQNLTLSTSGTLFVFANSRYCLFWHSNNNGVFNNNGPSGIIEISKDIDAEVTGDYPRFIFTNQRWMTGLNRRPPASFNTAVYEKCASLPRNAINNATGESGAYNNLSIGIVGARTAGSQGVQPGNPLGSNTIEPFDLRYMIGRTNPFDGNKPLVYTPYLIDTTLTQKHIRGRLFGVKFAGWQQASPMDKMIIPVDEHGFFDSNGTPTEHWITRNNAAGSDANVYEGIDLAIPC